MSHSATTQMSDVAAVANPEEVQIAALQRNAANYFERFERYESQELLGYCSTHHLLSEEFRFPIDAPMGLYSNVLSMDSCVILVPEEDDPANQPLDYRELHQIIRELMYGIYILNQTPTISLEANFDQGTVCQLPPAYQDTRIGQILINVDYMMKSLWHGSYFPKEKRTKFSEKWRSNFMVNPSSGKPETKKSFLIEFMNAGCQDITKDPEYADVYASLPVEAPGDNEMAEERRFFMSHVDNISMQIVFFQRKVQHHKELFLMDCDWLVSSVVKLLDDKLNHTDYERINSRLQMHEKMIKENLEKKAEIRRQMQLLKFISYMTPFLMGMRKRMKIPDISRLLPNLTGILIDIETDVLEEAPSKYQEKYEEIIADSKAYLNKILDPDSAMMETYRIPTITIGGKSYYMVMLEFERFYPQVPQKPLWVRVYKSEIQKLRPKKLPINDQHLQEQFKKYYGHKKALKYRTPANALIPAAHRGLVAIFQTLCRKMQANRLGKQDEHGMSLLHYAAMNNRPQIITFLLMQSMDVNVRRNNIAATGPTALHVAARCGALDAVACLIANFANVNAFDSQGWAPIHHAAFYDHEPIIKLMIRKNAGVKELTTKNELKSTPLLLAASSGGLAALKCLIKLDADITKTDNEGNGMVQLAGLRFHTNVLEYLIEWDHPKVPVWKVLVNMLNDADMKKKDSSVKCLEVLSTSKPDHWRSILEADGVPALVSLLKIENDELQSVAASVLCNISEQDEVRKALTKADAGPILIKLLGSHVDDIQSRAAIILSDLACIAGNQDMVANQGGIPPLINLLDSELEDVLVNAVNAIRILCYNNPNNQTAVNRCGGIEPLVEFLTVDSQILQAATSASIAAISAGHKENQDAIVAEGAVKPLVDLLKGRNETAQVKAANAIEALATNNQNSQSAFIKEDAPKALIRLLKNIKEEVREQVACALWSLAGITKTQQKKIAETTGIPHIIQMLLDHTEKLLYVGCMMAIALGKEDFENQNKLARADIFSQLVRLLRSNKVSSTVLLMVIKVLGILCVGVAYRNNKITQRKIAEEGAVPHLVRLLNKPLSEEIQVEVAMSLGCIILCNPENQEKLTNSHLENQDKGQNPEDYLFKFAVLLELLKSKNMEIRLRAGMALSIFAFNNTHQQYAIREAGGIKYSVFEPFINSNDEYYVCCAAFQ
ncbi:hypothetical protein ACJMK2_024159, partial [Sinanodonta woodiana]